MSDESEFPEWLGEAAIGLASGDLDAWMDMYAEEAVHEFPFAAAGETQRLEGKAAIREYMAALDGQIQFGSLDDVHVRQWDGEYIIEATGHHFDGSTGAPFDLQYLWIISTERDEVTRLRDYMGPRRPTSATS